MRIFSAMLALIGLAVSGTALAESNSDKWQFELTPYLWLPTIDGTLSYNPPPGGGGPELSVGPTDWLDLINGGLLINGSASKGRFTIFGDVVYLSLQSKEGRVLSVDDGNSGGPVNLPVSADITLNTQSDLDGLVWMLAAGYTVKETEASTVEVFAGVRVLSIDASSNWNLTADITTPGGTQLLAAQGGIAEGAELTDGIIGVRGRFGIGESKKWSVPYSLDVGAGSSDLTWNAVLGLARKYGWGDLMFVYRHLEYDEEASGLLQNFSFSGPAIGARFHF